MPCPHCDNHFAFDFGHIKFEETKDLYTGKFDIDEVKKKAKYLCPCCHNEIKDGHKIEMLSKGHWQPLNPLAPPETKSYHINRMYNPYVSFKDMAVEF